MYNNIVIVAIVVCILTEIMCDMGMIDQLVGHLQEEHSSFHEHIMSALLAIVRHCPRACQECHRHELNIIPTLKQRVEVLTGKEEFQVCGLPTLQGR